MALSSPRANFPCLVISGYPARAHSAAQQKNQRCQPSEKIVAKLTLRFRRPYLRSPAPVAALDDVPLDVEKREAGVAD
jgi:hypothetical protein